MGGGGVIEMVEISVCVWGGGERGQINSTLRYSTITIVT